MVCASHLLNQHPDLRWRQDCNLYVMSGYSSLSVGPIAGNLLGGRVCAERIEKSLWQAWTVAMDVGEMEETERPALGTLSDMAANFCNYWTALTEA